MHAIQRSSNQKGMSLTIRRAKDSSATASSGTASQSVNQRRRVCYRPSVEGFWCSIGESALRPALGGGAELEVFTRPADRVSGDLLAFVRLDRSRVGLVLADATGHGLSAFRVAMVLRRTLQLLCSERAPVLGQPARLLSRLNQSLLEENTAEDCYATAVAAVYNEDTRSLQLARAGACLPAPIHRQGEARWLRSEGLLLGAIPRPRFETLKRKMQPGETLVLHTDGLELLLAGTTHDPAELQPAMRKWLAGLRDGTAFERFTSLRRRFSERQAANTERDDTTVVLLRIGEPLATPTVYEKLATAF